MQGHINIILKRRSAFWLVHGLESSRVLCCKLYFMDIYNELHQHNVVATGANSNLGQTNIIKRRHGWVPFLVKLLHNFLVCTIFLSDVKNWRIQVFCSALYFQLHLYSLLYGTCISLGQREVLGRYLMVPLSQEIPNCINCRKETYIYIWPWKSSVQVLWQKDHSIHCLYICTEIHSVI